MILNIQKLREIEPKTILLGNYPQIIQSILDYDFLLGRSSPSIVGIIGANKRSDRYFWGKKEVLLNFYKNIKELPNGFDRDINLFLNVTSARRVLSSTETALNTLKNLSGGVIFGENTPEKHSLQLYKNLKKKDLFIIGPSSVGILVPGKIKLGAIGGVEPRQLYNPVLYNPGKIAVFSASGGMTNELINIVSGFNKRISFCLSFGGDRFPITTPPEAFLAAQEDPQTSHIIYFGELGGTDEYEIVELIKTGKLKKPVVTYIGGSISEYFPTPPQFGHAKAMAKNREESAKAKTKALNAVGINAASSFKEFVENIKKLPDPRKKDLYIFNEEVKSLHQRKKALFASSVSQETETSVAILGKDLLDLARNHSFSYIVTSMLLGQKVKSEELEEFSDLVLKLLVDNGPSVSGAINTIITARAGKDLVSSLAAGILTIGKRFGGAVNGAATNWLRGATSGKTAKEFVEKFAADASPIEGIGHKKYRIDNPDPRVAELTKWTKKLKARRFLSFARDVEKLTTAKKANLILNVDGAMAAIFLDILSEKEGFTDDALKELTKIEFFNAFFVIPRSVGFIAHYLDQQRLDEGLFRLPKEEVAFIQKGRN